MFPVTTQALNEFLGRDRFPNKWDIMMLRIAEKTVEQNKIATDVFTAHPARFVRVASRRSRAPMSPGSISFLASTIRRRGLMRSQTRPILASTK
jgi:hypothetical protein